MSLMLYNKARSYSKLCQNLKYWHITIKNKNIKTIKIHTNKKYRPFLNFAIVKFLYDFELDQRKLKVDKVTGGTLYFFMIFFFDF